LLKSSGLEGCGIDRSDALSLASRQLILLENRLMTVAIVEVSPDVPAESPKYSGFAQLKSPLSQPLPATLYGAMTGINSSAALCGTLSAYGGPYGVWKNSWMVLPSGLISQGDSGGTLVVNSTKGVVGLVVGGSRYDESPSYLVQYAHDMECV
jgi:hypothetical protein